MAGITGSAAGGQTGMARQVWKLEDSYCFDLPPSPLPLPTALRVRAYVLPLGSSMLFWWGLPITVPCFLLTIALEVGMKPKASQSEPFPGS